MKRHETHHNRPLRPDTDPLDRGVLADTAPAIADRREAALRPPTRLMTRDEVAETYGVSKRHLELAPSRGDGPAFVRIGRSVRYRPIDVEAWLEANLVRPASEHDR